MSCNRLYTLKIEKMFRSYCIVLSLAVICATFLTVTGAKKGFCSDIMAKNACESLYSSDKFVFCSKYICSAQQSYASTKADAVKEKDKNKPICEKVKSKKYCSRVYNVDASTYCSVYQCTWNGLAV
ncbi:uncharacterized protein LOC100679225 [Nasonia vitripennis]|uniref:Uncharacterized protein n=1 Tax=Nasonia vitripennis TaxID=7425 RepID=A0A7M7GMD5_NASVI|nr:uncharacterized protein LOC100679225 [Nasonia vitripennis]